MLFRQEDKSSKHCSHDVKGLLIVGVVGSSSQVMSGRILESYPPDVNMASVQTEAPRHGSAASPRALRHLSGRQRVEIAALQTPSARMCKAVSALCDCTPVCIQLQAI